MKKLVPWVKSNLLIVLSLVIALVAVPVMIFFSAGMNATLRERLNEEVTKVTRDLSSIPVKYEIPSLDPGGRAVSVRAVPNDETTQAVAARLEELAGLSEQARDLVVQRNSAGKSPLVAGLFPKPADESARIRLTAEMVRAWPEAHSELLRNTHAGAPLDPAALLRRLENRRVREIDKIEQNRAEAITDEERAQIEEDLVQARLEAYRNGAKSASFYADASAFTKLLEMPEPDNLPKEDEYQRLFWDWQHAYWVHQDVIAAIVLANNSSRGWRTIIDAPVKRLLRVSVDAMALDTVTTGSLSEALPRDFKVSPTGRIGGNPLYDTRVAHVEMIVDASSINTVISAFSNTNFMGVLGMDIVWLEGRADLPKGFDYGDRAVARMTMDIETVWIRSWLEPLMPPEVKADMGIETPESEE